MPLSNALLTRGGRPLDDAEARLIAYAAAQQLQSLHDSRRAHGRLSLAALGAAAGAAGLSSMRLCGAGDAQFVNAYGLAPARPPPSCPHEASCLAPEAVGARVVRGSAAQDMWALGVVLYQCLTNGAPPFAGVGPGPQPGAKYTAMAGTDDVQRWIDIKLSEQVRGVLLLLAYALFAASGV